ncbi:MAG: DUF2189 domain-containing protein [Burkholderiaceae bacterium]
MNETNHEGNPPAGDGPNHTVKSRLMVNEVQVAQIWHWLCAGWRDFTRAPFIGLFFGCCFAMMGLAIYWVFQHSAGWTLALSAGFLLVGPFLCIGLFSVSRSLARGQRPSLSEALGAWSHNPGALIPYLAVLLVLDLLWSRSAMVVFAVSFPSITPQGDPLSILFDPANLGFVITYLAVGAIFAGVIFATSVVSIPLIMDRDVDGITAGITSIQVCLKNPLVMFLWGALVTGVIVSAMAPWFLGLVFAAPVIGHASWHAYCATVTTGESGRI